MIITTEDPGTIIEYSTNDIILYHRLQDDSRWLIWGRCNCCGLCEVGSNNPNIRWTGSPIGEANAEYDITYGKRRDIPILPEGAARCPANTLRGEYI